jgi:hypothetical protein
MPSSTSSSDSLDSNSTSSSSENIGGDFEWLDDPSVEEDERVEGRTPWICPTISDCHVTFDEATHNAWVSAKHEIEAARRNISLQLHLRDMNDYTLLRLVDYVFDRLWNIVGPCLNEKELYPTTNPLEQPLFEKILLTFFVASSFNMSTVEIFHNDFIHQENLCSQQQYIYFWKAIRKHDSCNYDESAVYLWQLIVDEINKICRNLFLLNFPSHIQKNVTVDDDKDHFNGKMNYLNTSGLKPNQFVRDNRRGFTLHTMVFSASGIPLGIEPELVSDKSAYDASTRLIKNQLAPAHRGSQHPNLSNVTLHADRGYMESHLLYDFILPSGMKVGPSTHKRHPHYPYTYEQKLKMNDKRILLSKKGGKAIRIMTRQAINANASSTLSAMAYSDGHGKIVLGICSGSIGKDWDFHLKNPRDRDKMSNFIEWKGLSNFIHNHRRDEGLSDEFIDSFLGTCEVDPVTTTGSEGRM